ncbi:MAG: hypothetical protein ACP5OV_07190 [Acidimicrobiales bacterium]
MRTGRRGSSAWSWVLTSAVTAVAALAIVAATRGHAPAAPTTRPSAAVTPTTSPAVVGLHSTVVIRPGGDDGSPGGGDGSYPTGGDG